MPADCDHPIDIIYMIYRVLYFKSAGDKYSPSSIGHGSTRTLYNFMALLAL